MRELVRDHDRLEHIVEATDRILGEVVIVERTHKSLVQTASRMKKGGVPIKQISQYTGLSVEEIEEI